MFPYSFGYALQEYVVQIEFGPVGNPMFFRAKRLVGLDSNYDQRGSE